MLKILKEYMDNISGEGVKEGRGGGGYRSSPPSPQEGRGGGGIGQVLHHPKFVFFFRLTTPLSNTFSNTIF